MCVYGIYGKKYTKSTMQLYTVLTNKLQRNCILEALVKAQRNCISEALIKALKSDRPAWHPRCLLFELGLCFTKLMFELGLCFTKLMFELGLCFTKLMLLRAYDSSEPLCTF
jgi:hypothetical protein